MIDYMLPTILVTMVLLPLSYMVVHTWHNGSIFSDIDLSKPTSRQHTGAMDVILEMTFSCQVLHRLKTSANDGRILIAGQLPQTQDVEWGSAMRRPPGNLHYPVIH
jgi:hypothetical protein